MGIKFKLTLLLLLLGKICLSQDRYLDSIKTIIKNDFALIDKATFTNLVPYSTMEGYRMIDAKTKKIVINRYYAELDFFKPNLRGKFNHNTFFEINANTKTVSVFADDSNLFSSTEKEPKKSEIKGFKIDDKNNLIEFSNKFQYQPTLLNFKNIPYAIVKIENKYGIINGDGDIYKKFDLSFDRLDPVYIDDTHFWLKYKKGTEQGFINMLGEKKLVNQIIKDSNSLTSASDYFIDDYLRRPYYGYSIESNDELNKYGILDLVSMKWVIKPQTLKIATINYSTKEKITNPIDINERKKIKFFFQVMEPTKNPIEWITYYIDEKMNKYVPK